VCGELSTQRRFTGDRDDAAATRARDLVTRFLERHVRGLYAELTDGLSRRLTITELFTRLEGAYPELLPPRSLLVAESARPLRSRRRLEVDQAVVLRGLLRDSVVGNHLLDTMRMPGPADITRARAFDASGVLELATLRVDRVGAAGHITLLNVDTLNAENDQLVADLGVAVAVVMLAGSVVVGVLRGGVMRHPKYAGRRVFCAGIDLRELSAGRISYLDFLIGREAGFLSRMTRGLLYEDGSTSHTPWIAVIDAFAIGGGLQMALATDHVIGGTGAFASLPAAQEGLVPGAANFRLPRRAGLAVAREMVLHGRTVGTADPDAGAIFDEIADPAELDVTVERAVSRLAAPAVRANKKMLALTVEPQDEFRSYLAEFAQEQAERTYAEDFLIRMEGRRP
jgi:thioesterase DpgC